MNASLLSPQFRLSLFMMCLGFATLSYGEDPAFSPQAETATTELPPLKVPEGFQVELLFQVPEIEHPSVVTCDDAGNLFIGENPMDMRGPATEEIDRILLVRWNPQGGPPTKTVFCDKLSAVFGMVWHNGALYVMHAPHYTMFRDTNGDGVADVRQDLADGFGPPAGVFGFNDHIVTGTRLGMDGLIYVSVGDKGIQKATGADGSNITLEGGGVVRMHPDGTQLEVVSSGTRNHLDVAMDSFDNIFTYDNTDDGLGWWTRFTHHVPTGYYGYPYDYHPHPDRHLPRISEHGGGSPCGGDCYREAAWPERYRNTPFFCEWGKGKVQNFSIQRRGATFTAKIEDFATKTGGGEFRPVDLCFSPDGKFMYLADWNYGGWVNPTRAGRVFRIRYIGTDVPAEPPRFTDAENVDAIVRSLEHPSHHERLRAQHRLATLGEAALGPLSQVLVRSDSAAARIHAIWAQNELLETIPGFDPSAYWLASLGDPNAEVRGQAGRALGYRRVKFAARSLERMLADPEPTVRLQVAIALGRIGDRASATPIVAALGESDETVRFAMLQALKQIGDWRPMLPALRSADERTRKYILLALTGIYDEHAVAVLRQWSWEAPQESERAAALALAAEIHRKSEPYAEGWWGTQPAKGKPSRPRNLDWSGTPAVLALLDEGLTDSAPAVRLASISGLRLAYPNHSGPRLRELVLGEHDLAVRKEAIASLVDHPDPAALKVLLDLSLDKAGDPEVRGIAINAIGTLKDLSVLPQLVSLATEDSVPTNVLIRGLTVLGDWKAETAKETVARCLSHHDAAVRACAVQSLAKIAAGEAAVPIASLLKDPDLEVRKVAAKTLGSLRSPDAIPALVDSAADTNIRFEVIQALAAHPDRRALGPYLDELAGKSPELRVNCRKALIALRQEIGEDVIRLHERNELPADIRVELQSVFSAPLPVTTWMLVGPFPKDSRPVFDPNVPPDLAAKFPGKDVELAWKEVQAKSDDGMINVEEQLRPTEQVWGLAYTAIESENKGTVHAFVGSDDQLVLWVNGEQVYDFQGDRGFNSEEAPLKLAFKKGINHIYALTGNTSGPWSYGAKIGRRDPRYAFLYENAPEKLEPTAYAEFANKNAGNADRGRKLFEDRQGVACIKCHAVGGQGGKVGPDLVGIGGRYPRDELIRSVLEPSNRVLASYQVTVIATVEGEVLQGIVKSETPEKIELVVNDGSVKEIAIADIDSKQKSNVSLMPNGLKDGMALEDFADIIAYMESLKESTAASSGP